MEDELMDPELMEDELMDLRRMGSATTFKSFSDSKRKWINDVFINFRGEDTRRSFVSHLVYALKNAGVKTYLDEENLHKGLNLRELFREIESSQICIVIFSRNYTESIWCLDELEKIMECDPRYGQIVLPIFYDVEPSDVRHLRGAFGKDLKTLAEISSSGQDPRFADHCLPRTSRNKATEIERRVSKWSSTLKTVADISGWHVKKHRNEAQLVKEIVENVLRKLDKALLSITEFPVGLESRVQNVMGFIENQSSNVCIIGIWGMGGLGKTTTAKAIYNQIHHRFMGKSFIEDIREVCETDRRGHVRLQEQLVSDVLKTKVNICSVGMGKAMMKNKLFGTKSLIVLDDVNEFDQLQDLCGDRKWFGQGTVIIITSRDVRLLTRLNVDYICKMWEMDENESLELFSWHAFGEAKPKEDFNELARNVVAYCVGLPLALEVLGSYLIDRTKKEWESVLSKLEQIPNDQVQNKLRISFDGLSDDKEKSIFLDVCCFFIGQDRAYVTEILNGCGLCADIGIAVLIERSLIKVEKNNKLEMHPLLRDMGREIICEKSRNEPGKRSRLWFQKDVLDVLATNTGTKTIEGLVLNLDFTSRDCFEAYVFEEMKRLRLLQLDHVQLTGDYGYLSKHLRWICWHGFGSKYIPKNFCVEGVIAMDLKYSHLRRVWKEPQVLLKLKFLNLSHSKYLTETPDFSTLPNLEKLVVKDCPSLCKVHQSIGKLKNLLFINLKDCTSLSNLPREIYKLKSVKTLILSGCSMIEKLEEDIVQMESLTTLIAENTAVKQVPFSIVRSKSIGYISLCGHEGLSRNVFPSIIWSWMSPTMNPLSRIHLFSGPSSSIVSMDMQNNDLGDLAPMLSNLSNVRSVLMTCDTVFQLSKFIGDLYGVNFTELEVTSYTSQISKPSLRSYLIGIGSYKEVFKTLSKSISEGLATSESCDVYLPGDNYPYWLAHTGEGRSVYFTVPKDCRMKGMTLCVAYLSDPENTATKCLSSVLVVNYTKCTIQIQKRETVISFNDVDWQAIISHLGPGDEVEIFVIFEHELLVKKTAVYLIFDESIDMEMEPSPKPKKEPKKNAFKISNINKRNCSKYEDLHCMGAKNLPRRIYEMTTKAEGVQHSGADIYIDSRTRRDGSIVPEKAPIVIDELKKKMVEAVNSQNLQSTQDSTNWTNDIYSKIKRPEKRRHVHCLGKLSHQAISSQSSYADNRIQKLENLLGNLVDVLKVRFPEDPQINQVLEAIDQQVPTNGSTSKNHQTTSDPN